MPNAVYSPNNQNRTAKIDELIPSFSGLNRSKKADDIADTDLSDCLNVVYDMGGAVEMRPGSSKLLTTSLGGPILGIHPFYNPSLSIKQIIYGSVANLYHYDNAGGSTSISSTLTSGARWEFATGTGKTFAVNGQDGLLQYTGSGSFTLVMATYKFTCIRFYKNRLWGYEANSSVLRFSDAGNPTSWPTNNYLEVNTDDGEVLTGLDDDVDVLTIHKSESIWYLTGEPLGSGSNTTLGNLQLRKANSEVGACAYRTIAKISRGIQIFAASDGLYILQNYRSYKVSDYLEPIFKTEMNPDFMDQCWGIYNRTEKKYLFGYPSAISTTPDKVIMCDFKIQGKVEFSIWDNMPGSCAVNFEFSPGAETTLIGHPTKGYIYEPFKGYSDISSGDNGTSSGSNTSTTLNDTTKAWTTNQHVDAVVSILSGTGRGQTRHITANTATGLTVDTAWSTTPDNTSAYTIGGYLSYADTKIFNQRRPALYKKYKYCDVFTDSEGLYNLQTDVAYDYEPLGDFTDGLSLDSGAMTWGMTDPDTGVIMKWGKAGKKWGGSKKLHKRLQLGGAQAKQVQYRFGNNKANQPWRLSMFLTTYKEKKNRPDA